MKKVLFAATVMMFLVGKAEAGLKELHTTPVAEVIMSTAVCDTVKVSSGTTQRVDNLGAHGALMDREWVRLVNNDTGDKIYFGYSSAVSTNTALSSGGEFINPEGKVQIGAVNNSKATIQVHAAAVDAAGAAGCRVLVCQGY